MSTFYFAWCGPNQPFDASVLREDETVFAFDLAHLEGQVPVLNLDVKNPHIGLLAPGRSQWAWLSYQAPDGEIIPLFYGWLVGLPTNLLAEVVTLQFIARPADFLAQKQAIANSLMYEPWYDPIWIDQSKWSDPDTVLETYAMTWHVDRVNHVVTVSDILFGEDGTQEFQQEDAFYDSVSISFASSPQTRVVFDGTVQWTQASTGTIRLPDVSFVAWNGQQIVNDWPKPGNNLGGGWSIEDAVMINWTDPQATGTITLIGGGTVNVPPVPPSITISGSGGSKTVPSPGPVSGASTQTPLKSPTGVARSDSYTWHSDEKNHYDGEIIGQSESVSYAADGSLGNGDLVSHSYSVTFTDSEFAEHVISSYSVSYGWSFKVGTPQQAPPTTPSITISFETGATQPVTTPSLFGQILLRYNLSYPRTETISFIMDSQLQAAVLLPPDEPINLIQLSMHGADLGLPIDPGGIMPIGDPQRSAFFPTDRGQLALQYPMLVARAHLMQSARAVKIAFECPFDLALDLSCRKNVLLHDPRLPGGQVTGKITEYHLKVDGDKGQVIGVVQIETTIGLGLPVVASEGEPSYVDDGYLFVGYQYYTDAEITLPGGDGTVVAPSTTFDPTQMVLPLTYDQAVVAFAVHDGTPIDVVESGQSGVADPTWLEIVLNPVIGQKFETDYNLGYSTLVMPKLIDLAAPSASLEQIIRPFVVDLTLPPEPYITTANDPPPDLVRLNIGVGQTKLTSLPAKVAPIVTPPPPTSSLSSPTIVYTTMSSSYSYSVQFYYDQKTTEQTDPNQ